MHALILYSQPGLGFDPLIDSLQATATVDPAITQVTMHEIHTMCDVAKLGGGKSIDIVLSLDATEWFLTNRMLLPDRTWNCCVSFNFADLLPLYAILNSAGILESGFNAIFANNTEFIRRVSAAVPSKFVWRPVYNVPPKRSGLTFGTVLPNIADRDFSQLAFTAKWLKENKQVLIVYMSPKSGNVPKEIEPYVCPVDEKELTSMYGVLTHYIPAPRLTDIQGRVVPPEIVQAAHAGCKPLLIFHPLWAQLGMERFIRPMFRSLRSYEDALDIVVKGGEPVEVNLTPELTTTTQQLWTTVMTAYRRWKANAPADGL